MPVGHQGMHRQRIGRNDKDAMTLSRSLDGFYVPQFEQLGTFRVKNAGRSLFARVQNESCFGYLLAFEVSPSCILTIHEIDVREPLLIEEDLPEHLCLCSCSGDSLAGVPQNARSRRSEKTSIAYAQPKECFTMPMNPGERFKCTSLCLLPEYFDEVEERFPSDFRGLGDRAMSHSPITSDFRLDRIINSITAANMLRPGALPSLESKVLEATCCLNEIFTRDSGTTRESSRACAAMTAFDIMKIIELSMPNPPTLEQLCSIAHMGHTTLSGMFKFETGMPLGEYIRSMRMNAAKELLVGTNLSTREIGEMVGYGDAASFTKAFKRCVGMTPGRYRDESIR